MQCAVHGCEAKIRTAHTCKSCWDHETVYCSLSHAHENYRKNLHECQNRDPASVKYTIHSEIKDDLEKMFKTMNVLELGEDYDTVFWTTPDNTMHFPEKSRPKPNVMHTFAGSDSKMYKFQIQETQWKAEALAKKLLGKKSSFTAAPDTIASGLQRVKGTPPDLAVYYTDDFLTSHDVLEFLTELKTNKHPFQPKLTKAFVPKTGNYAYQSLNPILYTWHVNMDAPDMRNFEEPIYGFSSNHINPLLVSDWLPSLDNMANRASDKLGLVGDNRFNAALVGFSSVETNLSAHKDNDPWFGSLKDISVGSVSIGQTRKLRLKRDRKFKVPSDQAAYYDVKMKSKSLLAMMGNTQVDWTHQLLSLSKKDKKNNHNANRINITFRSIKPNLIARQHEKFHVKPTAETDRGAFAAREEAQQKSPQSVVYAIQHGDAGKKSMEESRSVVDME